MSSRFLKTATGHAPILPESFSTTDGGVADYLVGITTDVGFSSAVVSAFKTSLVDKMTAQGLVLLCRGCFKVTMKLPT